MLSSLYASFDSAVNQIPVFLELSGNGTFAEALATCEPEDRFAYLIANFPTLNTFAELTKILELLAPIQAINYCVLIASTLRRLIITPADLVTALHLINQDARQRFLEVFAAQYTIRLDWTPESLNELMACLPVTIRLHTALQYINLAKICDVTSLEIIAKSFTHNEIEEICTALGSSLGTSVISNSHFFFRIILLFEENRRFRLFQLVGSDVLNRIFKTNHDLVSILSIIANDEHKLLAYESFDKDHLASLFIFETLDEFLKHATMFSEPYRYRFCRAITFEPLKLIRHFFDLIKLFKYLGRFTTELMVKNFSQQCFETFFAADSYRLLRESTNVLSNLISNIHKLLSTRLPIAYFNSIFADIDQLCDWISYLKIEDRWKFSERLHHYEPTFFSTRIKENDNALQNLLLLFPRRQRLSFCQLLPKDFWIELINSPAPLGKTLYTLTMKEAADFPCPEEKTENFKLVDYRTTLQGFCNFLNIEHLETVLNNYSRLRELLLYLPAHLNFYFVSLLTPQYQQTIIIQPGHAPDYLESLSRKDKHEWQKLTGYEVPFLEDRRNSAPTVTFFHRAAVGAKKREEGNKGYLRRSSHH